MRMIFWTFYFLKVSHGPFQISTCFPTNEAGGMFTLQTLPTRRKQQQDGPAPPPSCQVPPEGSSQTLASSSSPPQLSPWRPSFQSHRPPQDQPPRQPEPLAAREAAAHATDCSRAPPCWPRTTAAPPRRPSAQAALG